MKLKTATQGHVVTAFGTALALLSAPGCKKQDQVEVPPAKTAPAAALASAAPAVAATTARVIDPAVIAAVNAAIPAAWQGKLEFVPREIKDNLSAATVTALVPKDWPVGDMPDEVVPPKTDSKHIFGLSTSIMIGKTCAGGCKPHTDAEFAPWADKNYFAEILARPPPLKVDVVKDEKSAGQRVLIVHRPTSKDGGFEATDIHTAQWKDGDDSLTFCMVTLSQDAGQLAPAFEQACLATKK